MTIAMSTAMATMIGRPDGSWTSAIRYERGNSSPPPRSSRRSIERRSRLEYARRVRCASDGSISRRYSHARPRPRPMVTVPISATAMLTGPSVMFPTTNPIVAWTDEQCRGSRAQIESRAQIDDLPIEPPGTVGRRYDQRRHGIGEKGAHTLQTRRRKQTNEHTGRGSRNTPASPLGGHLSCQPAALRFGAK